jgi:hypothetical protein
MKPTEAGIFFTQRNFDRRFAIFIPSALKIFWLCQQGTFRFSKFLELQKAP